MRTLVISGHPDLDGTSTANSRIVHNLESAGLDLRVRRLHEICGDFSIDVAAEQEALLDADLVVIQSPMYWYSVTALLKHWFDEVFSYGFAYGSTGTKLKGKGLLLSMTISSPADCYQTLGYNNYSVAELLTPIKQTALHAKMLYQEPVLSYEALYIPGIVGTSENVQDIAASHSEELIGRITSMKDSGLAHPRYSKDW